MKTKLLMLIAVVCLLFHSCKKETTSTLETNETDTMEASGVESEITADSVMIVAEETTAISEEVNLKYDFVLEKLEERAENSTKISLPSKFSEADFIEKINTEEVDLLIGNLVKIERIQDRNRYFTDMGKNYKKHTVNLKLKIPTEPIIYENAFAYGDSENLDALIGGISHSKERAYLFQILELGNLYVDEKDLDINKLKSDTKNRDIDNLYIIKGVTNYSLRATAYEKDNLKGNFRYAISVSGEKYRKAETSSRDSKIAITAISLKDILIF